jgi:tetrahydromethanopterin S-methyltransferase subunit G
MVVMTPRDKWPDERLDDLNKKVDDGFSKVDARFDRVEARFDRIDERFEALHRDLHAGAVIIIAALIGLIGVNAF